MRRYCHPGGTAGLWPPDGNLGDHYAVPRHASRRLLPAAVLIAAVTAVAAVLPGSVAQAASDPAVPAVSTAALPPTCRIADLPVKFRSVADWSRTMVDWNYRLPTAYKPPTLVS